MLSRCFWSVFKDCINFFCLNILWVRKMKFRKTILKSIFEEAFKLHITCKIFCSHQPVNNFEENIWNKQFRLIHANMYYRNLESFIKMILDFLAWDVWNEVIQLNIWIHTSKYISHFRYSIWTAKYFILKYKN